MWYAANYFSGWTLLIAGIASLIAIVILHFHPQLAPGSGKQYGLILTAIWVTPLLLAVSCICSLKL